MTVSDCSSLHRVSEIPLGWSHLQADVWQRWTREHQESGGSCESPWSGDGLSGSSLQQEGLCEFKPHPRPRIWSLLLGRDAQRRFVSRSPSKERIVGTPGRVLSPVFMFEL